HFRHACQPPASFRATTSPNASGPLLILRQLRQAADGRPSALVCSEVSDASNSRYQASMSDNPRHPILMLLSSHWLCLLGAALTTTAGFSWLFATPTQIQGRTSNPYIGIIVFIAIPMILIAGLVLLAVGMFLSRRRLARMEKELVALPDRQIYIRKLASFLLLTTLANIVIGTQGTYRAVEHMETPQFCGQSCHVMKPEFTSHQDSPHANVPCVGCHVSPGMTGWVASK